MQVFKTRIVFLHAYNKSLKSGIMNTLPLPKLMTELKVVCAFRIRMSYIQSVFEKDLQAGKVLEKKKSYKIQYYFLIVVKN